SGARSLDPGPYAQVIGIPVAMGNVTEFTVSLRPWEPAGMKLRVIDISGQPRRGQVAIESRITPPDGQTTSGQLQLDDQGFGQFRQEITGIWGYAFKYKLTPYNYGDPPEPYMEAAGYAGVSS